ncbi:peptidase S8, partial [Camelliibacillus cellulosilyticus]
DDGTAENAHSFYDAGNAWGVKMELPKGHDHALITGGKFRFWDTEWPVPGGTDFQVEIWDATGTDGAPGHKLAGPINATAKKDGTWTTVDLSSAGVVVDGDFYMVYVQSQPNPYDPGLATDESSGSNGHSWQRVAGAWSPSPQSEGNYMIRALVSYEVTAPEITAPKDNTYTNQDKITVEGKAAPTTTVHILNNGEEIASTTATDEGTFSKAITLSKGDNVLTATASTDSGTTDPSAPVKVVLDQDKPKLTIDSPADRSKTNRESVTVEGTVSDANLDWVKVNGQKAAVNDDGTYAKRILLDNGVNTIKVVAQDKAGNKRTKSITVDAKFIAPKIDNLQPTEDKYLNSGETVTIEFD